MQNLWLVMQSEEDASSFIEASIWPAGIVCPHCGVVGRAGSLKGLSTRPGLRKCYACQMPFTAKGATNLRSSHLSLHLWLRILWFHLAGTRWPSAKDVALSTNISAKTASRLNVLLANRHLPLGLAHQDDGRRSEARALISTIERARAAGAVLTPREQSWLAFLRTSVDLECDTTWERFQEALRLALSLRVDDGEAMRGAGRSVDEGQRLSSLGEADPGP